jgi:hypothetical protein
MGGNLVKTPFALKPRAIVILSLIVRRRLGDNQFSNNVVLVSYAWAG